MPDAPAYHFGFSGTRRGLTDWQLTQLSDLLINISAAEPNPWPHHGDCTGGDEQFHDLCLWLKMSIVIHPPILDKHRAHCLRFTMRCPAKSYLDRNDDIVRVSEYMIICPGQETEVSRSGTWYTYREALRRGKSTQIIYPGKR